MIPKCGCTFAHVSGLSSASSTSGMNIDANMVSLSASPRSTAITPSSSWANGPSTTSLAVVIMIVSGSRLGPIEVVNTFLRSAPFLPAVFLAWAYSSIITNEANKPSLVLALAVKHCMRLSRPRSLKVIFSRLTLKCFSLGSISNMMFRISSKHIFA